MSETFSLLPVSFWVAIALIAGGVVWAAGQMRSGLGLPVLTVLGTVSAWYVGDAFYNDYPTTIAVMFTPEVRAEAWWQVAWFVLAFLFLVPEVHRRMLGRGDSRTSQLVFMFKNGTAQPQFQRDLRWLFWACFVVWVVLSAVAVVRLQEEAIHYFFPYIGYRADPWARNRIGSGFDFMLSLAAYLQIVLSALFGILAALIRDPKIRLMAAGVCLLLWPYFIFDRTRNTMLAAVAPAILAWVFLRLRVPMFQRILILAAFFAVIDIWFAFVIAHRSTDNITYAFNDQGLDLEKTAGTHHEGLNMYQELCWINTFIDEGRYSPNWGQRYFAELVNPIPRTIWPGKPLIGIDYAILRGQAYDPNGDGTGAGVGATISTGMIGQGVVNFGTVVGPAFAALLMSIWVAILARLDLAGQGIGRIPLYAVGLILTFNLGRDITLITLYTFVFGMIIVWALEHWLGRKTDKTKRTTSSKKQNPVKSVREKEILAGQKPLEYRSLAASPGTDSVPGVRP